MAKKITHGGARKKAGRKPIDESEKKQQVNLFLEGWVIKMHGGKSAVQDKCYRYLRNRS